MSTAVWPPLPPDRLIKEEEASLARELDWLLDALQETLQSLKEGLEDCNALLAPQESGTTLVLSSLRSEALKGFVTRVGTRIVKGEISIRLPSLPPPRGLSSFKLSISSAHEAPTLALEQLAMARTLVNACLDVVDMSRWTGNAKDADFIAGQFKLLHDNLDEARQTLKGGPDVQRQWWEVPVDENTFDPPLPPNLSFHLSVHEAALELQIRTLEQVAGSAAADTFSGFSIRDRLVSALGASRAHAHDEVNEIFTYKGQTVRVKEKLRVESQDPSLIAALAKLNALENTVTHSRKCLDTVMGKEE